MDIVTLFSTDTLVLKMIVGLLLGLFIGLRREIDIQKEGSESFIGFRTMPLIVLFGVLSVSFPALPLLPVIALVGIVAFLSIAYYNGVFRLNLIGLTSEFATLIMFLVGVLVGYGSFIEAILLTVIIGFLTGFKSQLHGFAKTISPKEWGGALQLLILSAVVLPFLPREAIDPLGVLVPFEIWLLVIFISGIGFVGYFLNKYIDAKKGLVATSFLGSMVSSTAVTTALAIKAKQQTRTHKNIFVVALLVAIGTMLVRTIITIVALAPMELKSVIIVPLCMLVAAGALLVIYSRKDVKSDVALEADLHSPFELIPALKFGALFVVVLLAVALGKQYLGSSGVYITAFLSSMVDVDATILSSLQTFRQNGITLAVAQAVIVIAIIINTLVKVGYVWFLSRKDVALTNTFTVTIISLVGLLSLFFI